ncbi:MAG: hypothetical protein WCR19_04325 [Acholeplasmataceae bacterium]
MSESIIKYTVSLDKKAREEISKLEEEKVLLDQKVKDEAKALKEKLDKENKEKLETAKKDYIQEIEDRKNKELTHYKAQFQNMEEQFGKNEEQWIEEIFQECIKA